MNTWSRSLDHYNQCRTTEQAYKTDADSQKADWKITKGRSHELPLGGLEGAGQPIVKRV